MRYITVGLFLFFLPLAGFCETETLEIKTIMGGGSGGNTTGNTNLATATGGVTVGYAQGEVTPSDGDLFVAGKVGIGTGETGTNKLVVDTGSSGLKLKVSGDALSLYDAASDDHLPYIQWYDAEEDGSRAMYLGWGSTAESKYIDMALESGYKLAITGGNVGIGTTAPGAKLEVKDTNVGVIIDGNPGDQADITFRQNAGNIYYAGIGLFTAESNNAGLSLWSGGLGVRSPSLYIKNDGNVGIGTTAPQSYARLEVNTTGSKSIYTMDSANGGLLIGYGGSSIQGRSTSHANTDLYLNNYGGNVGIGTTSPGSKLWVKGDVAIEGDIRMIDGEIYSIRGKQQLTWSVRMREIFTVSNDEVWKVFAVGYLVAGESRVWLGEWTVFRTGTTQIKTIAADNLALQFSNDKISIVLLIPDPVPLGPWEVNAKVDVEWTAIKCKGGRVS